MFLDQLGDGKEAWVANDLIKRFLSPGGKKEVLLINRKAVVSGTRSPEYIVRIVRHGDLITAYPTVTPPGIVVRREVTDFVLAMHFVVEV